MGNVAVSDGYAKRYKIQDRTSVRSVTVPPDVPLKPEMTVWISEQRVPEEDEGKYLKISLSPPDTLGTEVADMVCAQQGYRVRENGRGKMLTIPDYCDDNLFPAGGYVIVLSGYEDDEFSHLEIVPEHVYWQSKAVSGFTE